MQDKLSINIEKEFKDGTRKVKLKFNHQIEIGSITGLYGASGIGKSTLIKSISGVVTPSSGVINYGNETWYSRSEKINVSPKDRSVALVFQDYNLFPNMSVRKNIMYASKNGKVNELSQKLINRLRLSEFIDEYPKNLSGGQRQRAAIVRAFSQEPQILLMDEPFSALDDAIIDELVGLIKEINAQSNQTFIICSHRKDVLNQLGNNMIHMTETDSLVRT